MFRLPMTGTISGGQVAGYIPESPIERNQRPSRILGDNSKPESPELLPSVSRSSADRDGNEVSTTMVPGAAPGWRDFVPAGLRDQRLYSISFVEDLELLSPVQDACIPDRSLSVARLGDTDLIADCGATEFEAEADMPSGPPAGPARTTAAEGVEIPDDRK